MSETLQLDQNGQLTEQTRREILRDAGLFIFDPASYPNLVLTMDPTAGLDLSFQAKAYNTAETTKEKVRCSVCSQKQFHNHGFIVRLMSGDVGLVGRDCGESHFFGSGGWADLESGLRIANDGAIFARRWGPAQDAINRVIPLATEWAEKLSEVGLLRISFIEALPDLFDAIRHNLRGDGLSTDRNIVVPYRTEDGELKERVQFVSQVVCRIDARWFFSGTDLQQIVSQQIKGLQTVVSALSADMESKAVIEVERKLRRTRNQLQDVAEQQSQLNQLMSAATWEDIAKWARAEKVRPANYRFKNSRMKCSDAEYDYGSLPLPAVPIRLNDIWESVRSQWPRL